jgi:negative regulator of sigma-B (phosphoserine phosphatase)
MDAPDMTVTIGTTDWVVWAAAGTPIPGQITSGDGHSVIPRPLRTLIAVMDGLGHGPEAHKATSAAIAVIAQIPDAPLRSLFERCNEALQRTRGVVMTIAAIAGDGQMEWLGVGNVSGYVVRSAPPHRCEAALTPGGVVGWRMPTLRARRIQLDAGDLVILATDGIQAGFASSVEPILSPRIIASRILDEGSRGHDDALVVVARYDGGRR